MSETHTIHTTSGTKPGGPPPSGSSSSSSSCRGSSGCGAGRGWGQAWAAGGEDGAGGQSGGSREPEPEAVSAEPGKFLDEIIKQEALNGLLPVDSFHKKDVAKRPGGYLKTASLQRIEIQPPSDCGPLILKGLEHHCRKHYRIPNNCSQKAQYKTELGLFHCDKCVNRAPLSLSVATGSAGNIAAGLQVQQSDNQTLPVCPMFDVCQEDTLPSYSSYAHQTNWLDPIKEVTHHDGSQGRERMHALNQKEVDHYKDSESKDIICNSSSSQDHFNSSFSFIQLSLNLAAETNGTEHPSHYGASKEVLHICRRKKAENVSLHVLEERQRITEKELCALSNHTSGKKCQGLQETAEYNKLQNCESVLLLHANAGFCCSTDSLGAASAGSSVTSGYESSNAVSDHSWDALMKKYESVLQECLMDNQNILKVNFLIRKLQRLQEKAVAEDDYERADKYRRKLEELEKEKCSLKFQLPSRHPSISSLLDRFKAQVQITLDGDVPRFSEEENQLFLKNKQKIPSLPYHEKTLASVTKRDQLLEEKEWIQKEIEVLRTRLLLLEAKDQQLKTEIQEQDKFIQAQDCDLFGLLSWVSLRELQAIGKDLADTSEASHKISCSLDFPESIKRLQEKELLLNMSIKDIAAKVCTSQKLCSTLRRKVSDIETQLPALLEAKILAVSGGNFCIAKDLGEEIKSLTAERKRLEELLNEQLSLSAKNVHKLERMKEGYRRVKEEMEQQESTFERTLKENAIKYMEILEGKLQSCGSQLLERVWEVDLEACQLLIQGFQRKEKSGCIFEVEESQTDEVEDAAVASLSTKQEQTKHFPLKDSKRSALQHPLIQNKDQRTHWEPEEDCHMLSTEVEAKCEKISERLFHLEDQLQRTTCTCDEDLIESLQREIQMVKETLQAMLVQLQPPKEAEEDAGADFLHDSWCLGKQCLEE
ncbi:disrupted in schizophrenia 1 protein [Sceloporus undulatus]|uniref:disrupted in schizophrenia 1 protein n=1 Tax=Sceloporus undulatus TaxID=8520 RepID=UPI001C4D248A|nr:disrupted in schizophrenia 1 protein [Sceloporus undulatus]